MNGNAAAVSVSGPSGIGKTALIRHFVGQIAGTDDVLVLSGRCYENESVPFKALDGVIDDLSRHLASIPPRDVESLLPPDVAALTRVFPVLLQVRPIAALRHDRPLGTADPSGLRRRAFGALRRPARAHREPAAAGRLHRRPAVGRRGQRRPPRGSPVAAVRAGHADALVVPE